MDPVTIVKIVGTAISLGEGVVKCIVGLKALKRKYHDAPLVVSTIIGQLYMVQAALDQLAKWNKPEHDRDPRYQQLAQQIDNSIDCFGPLIASLEQRLNDFELTIENDMTATRRLAFLWDGQETSAFSILLDRQVNAFNLLLQAVQCNTLAQQQDLLLREQSQSILQQAKDCSSSIIGLDDSSSFMSENTAGVSLMFDFDGVVLASKIYQRARRSHLRQAIKAHNQKSAQEKPPHKVHATSENHRYQASHPSNVSSRSPSSSTQTRVISQPNGNASQLAPTSKGSPQILILGLPGSGKNTALKGLRLATEGSYTIKERMSFRRIIWTSIIMDTRVLLEERRPFSNFPSTRGNEHYARIILEQPSTIESTPNAEVVRAISSLWADEGFRCAYERRKSFQSNDSGVYYAEQIQRLTSPDYIPTNQDILYARCETIGVTTFPESSLLKYQQCLVVDVGRRRKQQQWNHSFEHVSVVLFTVDTTAYAHVVSEDSSFNRMQEQLKEWNAIVNTLWSTNKTFLLVFTKLDLLEELLQRVPVGNCFGDYPDQTSSPDSISNYMHYLVTKFLHRVPRNEKLEHVRIVQGDLVRGSKEMASQIVEAINELRAMYPALVGVV